MFSEDVGLDAIAHTLCSLTNFLDTLWKYPSHIFLNRSLMSFSTSSLASGITISGSLVSRSFASPLVATLESCGEAIPKYGRE